MLDTLHSGIPLHTHALHSPLNTPLSSQSTLCTPPCSTLRSLHHWYDNRGRMYNTVGITCFMKIFYVAASLCVSASVPLPYVCAFGFVGRILFQLNFKKHRFIGCWRRAACLHFEHASRMCHMACRVCKDFNLIFFAGGLAILWLHSKPISPTNTLSKLPEFSNSPF